jgi:D-3-phosphoglycerate dehydrogenase
VSFTVLTIGNQIAPEGVNRIEAAGGTIVASGPYPPKAEFIALMQQHQPHAIVVRTIEFIDADMLSASHRLQLVAKHGVGVNEIDVAAAERLGIPVIITTGANSQSVAEHAFAMLLALVKDLSRQDRYIRDGKWDKRLYAGHEIKGSTLGLVGLGSISRKIARMGVAFGLKVIAYDPLLNASPVDEVTLASDLDALLAQADFVSMHCPATAETRNLLDARRIALMKPGAYFINTARGDVVDEPALIAALAEGRLAGAGLDVFETEPPAASALWDMPNVIHTPHVAGVTQEAMRAVSIMAADNIVSVLAGKPLDEIYFVNAIRAPRVTLVPQD